VRVSPGTNRFEFVVTASARAWQLLRGAVPREAGVRKVTIALREVLRRKVERVVDGSDPACR
jgi:DNA-directed RNA polymerase subunit K/omega